MEFFDMDKTTQHLTTSPQVWIYFVTAAATTILTMALYYFMAGVPKVQWKRHVGCDEKEDHVPHSLKRGYTDIEKHPTALSGVLQN
jgi:hypothetical protein